MNRIEEKDNSESPVLKNSPEVFHEAVRDKEKRYHVINDNGEDYDLVYIKNDDLELDKPDEILFDLNSDYIDFIYNEENPENLWLNLFDGLEQLVV